KYIRKISIAKACCRCSIKTPAVARKTEFLYYQRLVELISDGQVRIDILLRFALGVRESLCKVGFRKPAPILWPDMDGQVIDVLIGVNFLEKLDALGADIAFVSRRDQMPRIEPAYERGSIAKEFRVHGVRFGPHRTRF